MGRAIAFAHSLCRDRQIPALRDENRMPNDRNGVQNGDLTIPLEQDRLIRSKCDCPREMGASQCGGGYSNAWAYGLPQAQPQGCSELAYRLLRVVSSTILPRYITE